MSRHFSPGRKWGATPGLSAAIVIVLLVEAGANLPAEPAATTPLQRNYL
jgi:hypothetical protein